MASIQELKRQIDLHELAARLGIKRGKGGDDALYHSPLHPDKNPSLSIYVNHARYGTGWKDHSGDCGGDHIDLVMLVQGGTKADAMRWLHDAYAIPLDRPQQQEAPKQKSQVEYIADKCIREAERAREYLQGRGISESAITAAIKARTLGFNDWKSDKKKSGDVGYGGDAAAFIVRNAFGQVVAVDMRFLDPAINGDVKTQTHGEKEGIYWTADPRKLASAERVYLVESSINALSIDSCNMYRTAAVSIRGIGNAAQLDLSFLRGKQAVICMDNDDAFPPGHHKAYQRPGPEAAWILYERLTALNIGAIMVDQTDWLDADKASINDVNDYLTATSADELRKALETYEPWLIAGMGGTKESRRGGRSRVPLPDHDFAQYWRFRSRLDFTSYIAKMERKGDESDETPVYSDLAGFRVASLSRVSVASAAATMTGDPDQAPVDYFAVTVQTPRHGAKLTRRVLLDDQLHNMQQWNKFGPIWQPAQFSRMLNILERTAHLGARNAANFVGLAWREGQLAVNEGPDCFFTDAEKQCPYSNLTFPSGPVADARRVISAYQETFGHSAAAMALVWALGGHLKAILGFWPHMMLQADKGAGKSTLIKRLERTIAFTMLSGQSLQTEFRMLTSISHTSHPIGWEEISARDQKIIDKAIGLLQENYQYTVTKRGSEMTEYLLSAPVLLAGEDVPARSLLGKLVRTRLAKKGPMIPDDLPRFPVRQWLEFLAGLDRLAVLEKYRELRDHCLDNSMAPPDDDGAKRMAGNYAAMLLAWRYLAEFAGMHPGEGNLGRDLLAEMNSHIKETSSDRAPWVWIMETALSEIDAGNFKHPFRFERVGEDVQLLIRPAHIIDHISTSNALREKWNALPVKTAGVFKRQLEHAGVLVDHGGEIERTILSRRIRHLSAFSLDALAQFGLSVGVRTDQPNEN
jgi:hypothetical protein